MLKQVLTGLGLGFGAYAIYRYFKPEYASYEGGGETNFLQDAVGGFLDVGTNAAGVISGGGLGMNISLKGLAHIKGWERFGAVPYFATEAERSKGIRTIGYGHVILPGESFDKITEAEAVKLLVKDLTKAEDAVNRLVKVPLTQNQYDGLVSLVFNIGVGSKALGSGFAGSTLLKLLNSGDYGGAQNQFMRWVYQGRTVLAGLVNRRNADMKLYMGVA